MAAGDRPAGAAPLPRRVLGAKDTLPFAVLSPAFTAFHCGSSARAWCAARPPASPRRPWRGVFVVADPQIAHCSGCTLPIPLSLQRHQRDDQPCILYLHIISSVLLLPHLNPPNVLRDLKLSVPWAGGSHHKDRQCLREGRKWKALTTRTGSVPEKEGSGSTIERQCLYPQLSHRTVRTLFALFTSDCGRWPWSIMNGPNHLGFIPSLPQERTTWSRSSSSAWPRLAPPSSSPGRRAASSRTCCGS